MIELRQGSAADASTLLAFFDEAVVWLVERGQPGQWGSEPWSESERLRTAVVEMAAQPGLVIAEDDGEPVGALIVGERMPYAPEADEPELYVRLLITSRRHRGRDVGGRLVDRARGEARRAGVELLRVDCYAAPTLVAWYERQGFAVVAPLQVGDWEGRLLAQRVGS